MNEQLYINGILMDVDGELDITLVFKSNIFNDVDKIETNSSKTISLPRTANNMMAIDYAGMAGSETAFPYTTHEAAYYRNGVLIVDGKAILLAIRDKIEIAIMWGAYKKIEGLLKSKMKLNELTSNAALPYLKDNPLISFDEISQGYFYAEYDGNSVAEDDAWLSTMILYNPTNPFSGNIVKETPQNKEKVNNSGTLSWGAPTVTADWLLSLIEEETGVDIQFPERAKKFISTLAIPLTSNKANELSIDAVFVAHIMPQQEVESGYVDLFVTDSYLSFFEGIEVGKRYKSLKAKKDVEVEVEVVMNYKDFSNDEEDKYFIASLLEVNGYPYSVGGAIIGGVPFTSNTIDEASQKYKDEENAYNVTIKGKGAISLKEGDELKIYLGDGNSPTQLMGGEIRVYLKPSDIVESGMNFPIAINLPDITIVDFLKCMFFLSGVSVKQISDDGKLPLFLCNDVKDYGFAQDWTRKLVSIDETVFDDGDMAQKNHYRWEEDETVKGNYDYTLTIDNKTLAEERDAYTLPFAASDGNRVPVNKWEDEESVNVDQPEFVEVTPRLMTMYPKRYELEYPEYVDNTYLRFDIDLGQILKEKHPLISSPNRFLQIKATVRMNDIDLLNFDETKPIYLAQTGAYYAVKELQANSKGNATATLIKI